MAKTEYRILVAEDNEADVYLIEEALRQHAFVYRLEVAEDGEEMLKMIVAIEQDPSQSCPALFLLDLNLPKHSGHEILARIRKSPRCASVPVIVVTSSDSPLDRARARELGASYYFRKPASLVGFISLGRIVGEFLEKQPDRLPG